MLTFGGRRIFLVVGSTDMRKSFTETVRSFVAGPPDLDPPAPGDWALTRPEADTRGALTVDLGSPHDHLSLV